VVFLSFINNNIYNIICSVYNFQDQLKLKHADSIHFSEYFKIKLGYDFNSIEIIVIAFNHVIIIHYTT